MSGNLPVDQALISKLTDIVINNLTNENFSAVELAKEAGLSYVTLHRRLKKIRHQDVSEFIREIRLKRAMEMIHNSEGTFAEISYRTGFSNPSYFNKCFHEYFGYPPGEVRKRDLVLPKDNEPLSEAETRSQKGFLKLWKDPIRRKRFLIPAGVISGLLVISIFYVLLKDENSGDSNSQSAQKSIVVLPFKNISNDEANQYFAEGVREEILNHLSRIKELRVISRTTAEQFKLSTMTSSEIAAKLKVNYILGGSIQKQESKVRINVNLIEAKNDRQIWSETYDRDMKDIFAVQSDIAFETANNLRAKLTSREAEQIRKIPTKNMEAWTDYLYGRHFLNINPVVAVINKSIYYFEKAISNDPDFAPAYSGLATAYQRLAHYGYIPWTEGCKKARDFATAALKIDNSLSEPHIILGLLAIYDFKWEDARKEYLLAIEYEPDNPYAYSEYAWLMFTLGNMNEARNQANISLELDPLSTRLLTTSAFFYLYDGKIEEMGNDLRKMKEIDSTYTHLYRLYPSYYLIKGDTVNAIRNLKKYCDTDPPYRKYGPEIMDAYLKNGFYAGFRVWLQAEIEYQNPIYIAAAYTIMNRKDEALTWLEKALNERHSMISTINNAWPFDSLQTEPRFQTIIEKMGLTKYIKSYSADR